MFWTGLILGMMLGSVVGAAGLALIAINADYRH
jgi:hypothetical protein